MTAIQQFAAHAKPNIRSYDYIIVGAGSAGNVVAYRLVDTNATVTCTSPHPGASVP